ncbi:hypothetical protein Ddye_007888 [Dipteronia dyeriana]|uniref:S-protein homolog n=1 Tax=Dipteronia dyeriana TaxID=168575 RepID=A0AAD9XKU3_9ROSI|nr:hypothetical protein Ddye_007887 [Dipteronia dyeriana]KAK2661355.1 hypothetical protein Ddye_007888 [Dipteronia dyeriana]
MDMGLTLKSFLVIFVMTSISKVTMGFHFSGKTTIIIKNSFHSNAKSLYIHCRSKDDDIGEHWLAVGQTMAWSFRENAFSTTLFHCYAQWGNKIKRFNAYEYKGTTKSCCPDQGKVTWFLEENGLRAVQTDPKKNSQDKELTKLNWD